MLLPSFRRRARIEGMDEQSYSRGSEMAWRTMLQTCLSHLGDTERTKESWRLERAAAVSALRELCEDFGDNDWPDNLHLADVIEKHLHRHLESEREDDAQLAMEKNLR